MKKVLYFLLLVTLWSCSNDKEDNNSTSKLVLVKKLDAVDLGKNASYTFFYNDAKLDKVTYEIEAQTDGIGHYEYFYTGNLISEIKRFNQSNQNTARILFEYNSNNVLTQVTELDVNSNYGLKNVITYNSDGTVEVDRFSGNATSQSVFAYSSLFYLQNGEFVQENNSGTIQTVVNYEFDTANHPLQNVTGISEIKMYSALTHGLFNRGLIGLNNNLKKQTTTFVTDGSTEIVDYTINYNEQNYPTTIVSSPTSLGSYSYHYEYY
jgi:hypothetical protein